MRIGKDPEKALAELVERLLKAYSRDLRSVVLFGSAAAGDFHHRFSDLNVLVILKMLDQADLEKAEQIVHWWRALGNPAPLLLAEDELRRSTDAFPIEFLDIRSEHRILHGDDLVAGLTVDPVYHRVQVEHELRAKLVALRQRYVGIYRDKSAVLGLMVDSLPTFSALFRHALVLTGELAPPVTKRLILEHAARRFGFDAAPFLAVLERRENGRKPKIDVRAAFPGYLAGIQRVSEQVDLLEKKS